MKVKWEESFKNWGGGRCKDFQWSSLSLRGGGGGSVGRFIWMVRGSCRGERKGNGGSRVG